MNPFRRVRDLWKRMTTSQRTSRLKTTSRPAVECLEDRLIPSVTIQFDYSLDRNGFFNDPARRQVLQAAANSLTGALADSLTAMDRAPSDPGTHLFFTDPGNGVTDNIAMPAIHGN